MFQPLIAELAFMAAVVTLIGVLISRQYLSLPAALIISILRVLVPFLYFGLGFGGHWSLLDDVSYTEVGAALVGQGWSPWSILASPDGRAQLFILAGGQHTAYMWWNVLAQYLFGQGYAAAVFLNTAILFVAASLMGRICKHSGCDPKYTAGLYCYLLFHPELLVWTSIFNLKDVLVMTLTLALCYCVVSLSDRIKVRTVALLLGVVFVLFYIRYYVPLLFSLAVLPWLVFVRFRGRALRVLLRFGAVAAVLFGVSLMVPAVRDLLFAMSVLSGASTGSSYKGDLHPSIFETFKWLLMPRPWGIVPEYSFLALPSIFRWLITVPALAVAPRLFRSSKAAALCLIYLAITATFYGSYEELRGPRHRVQILFVLAWLEYHAIWVWARSISAWKRHYSQSTQTGPPVLASA